MKKIILSADSTSDLSKEYLDKYQIHTLPLYIHLDDKEYKDMVDIDPDFIYDYYDKHQVLPKTAAPSIGDFLQHFSQWDKEEYDIIHVSLGSGLSSSYQNAVIASRELENVSVVDSKSLSTGSGLLLIEAWKMAQEGKNKDEIVDYISPLADKLNVSFIVDSITYLREGGRLNALQAMGANLLRIKPKIDVINDRNGQMDVGKKYRGNIDIVRKKYIKDSFYNRDDIESDLIIFTHSGASQEQIDDSIRMIKEEINPKEIMVNKTSCTIASHCGYNTFGFIYLTK